MKSVKDELSELTGDIVRSKILECYPGLSASDYLSPAKVATIVGSSYQATRKMLISHGYLENISAGDLIELYTSPSVRIHPLKK